MELSFVAPGTQTHRYALKLAGPTGLRAPSPLIRSGSTMPSPRPCVYLTHTACTLPMRTSPIAPEMRRSIPHMLRTSRNPHALPAICMTTHRCLRIRLPLRSLPHLSRSRPRVWPTSSTYILSSSACATMAQSRPPTASAKSPSPPKAPRACAAPPAGTDYADGRGGLLGLPTAAASRKVQCRCTRKLKTAVMAEANICATR